MVGQKLADTFGSVIHESRTLLVGAMPLLYPTIAALGLRDTVNGICPTEADLDQGVVVLAMVLNRLIAPQPLYRVDRWLAGTILPVALDLPLAKLYDQRLGRALDALHPHLGEIWAQLVIRAIQVWQLDLSILHWDITSLYFRGAYTDSRLIRYGYSRDHLPDTKQINLEADVTHCTRVPVGYHLLPGQTADITRPVPHLDALLRFLARPELAALQLHPVLVSDCKMITSEAVAACHGNGLFYLGPWARTKAIEAVLRSVSDDELAAHTLAYRPRRQAKDGAFVPYRGVWRSLKIVSPAPADDPKAETKVFTDRVLVVWSAGKARLDTEKRRTYLKRLLDGLQGIQRQLNHGRYAQREYALERIASLRRGNPAKRLVKVDLHGTDNNLRLKFCLDRERLAAEHALDGRYAVGTNATHLTADEVLAIFKAQDGAEKQIRTMKGPLAIRPVFLHNDERIEGLVFVTLVALLVRALLSLSCRRAGLQVSVDQVLAEFASLSVIDLALVDGSHIRQVSSLTEFQAQTMVALGAPPCDRYLSALSSQG
jgi:transposase